MLIHVFLLGIFFVYHTNNFRWSAAAAEIISFGMLLFFCLVGNYLRTVRSNFFVGIRTPWTLSSETVWRKTHELAGKSGSTVVLRWLLLYFSSRSPGRNCNGDGVFLMALIPVVYSYLEFNRINHVENDHTASHEQ